MLLAELNIWVEIGLIAVLVVLGVILWVNRTKSCCACGSGEAIYRGANWYCQRCWDDITPDH